MANREIRAIDVPMLRTFDALMRERSVTRAAARLFVSQPAVTASLQRLREAVGDPLFTRTPQGIVPTERAHALAAHVDRALAELAAMTGDGSIFDPALSQRIFRVAGSDHASRLMLPGIGSRLVQLRSAIRLFWESGAPAQLGERLRAGEFDLAVLPRTHAPRDVEAALLYQDRYVLAARHGHPRVAGSVSVETFCDVPHVFLGYGTSALDDLIDEALQRAGHQRLAQIAVTTFSQMVDVLGGSDHIAVMPLRVARSYAERLQVQPLPIALPSYQLFLCWGRRSQADAGVLWLRDVFVAMMAAPQSAAA